MSDYLWDKSGEAEQDVERLEELLGRLRHAGSAPELPFEVGSRASTRAGFFVHGLFSRRARLAAAAALLLAVLAGAFALMLTVKKDGGRASVDNKAQVAQPQLEATKEAKPREEIHAPQVASSPSKESATPEPLQREPLRRVELVVSKSPSKSQRREPAPRETVASRTTTRDVRLALAQGGVFESTPDTDKRVRAKEQLVYALRLTSEALKQVRGRASGVEVRPNAFDGRNPLR